MIKAKEKEHYRITIDVVAKSDGVNRCGDIEHHFYMIENQLVPYTVGAEDVKYKVELLSTEAKKDLALTWEDMEEVHDICKLLVAEHFQWYSDQEFYEEVLRRFNKQREDSIGLSLIRYRAS